MLLFVYPADGWSLVIVGFSYLFVLVSVDIVGFGEYLLCGGMSYVFDLVLVYTCDSLILIKMVYY